MAILDTELNDRRLWIRLDLPDRLKACTELMAQAPEDHEAVDAFPEKHAPGFSSRVFDLQGFPDPWLKPSEASAG